MYPVDNEKEPVRKEISKILKKIAMAQHQDWMI